MQRLTLIVVLLAIIALCVAGYFIISKITPHYVADSTPPLQTAASPNPSHSPTSSVSHSPMSTTLCQKNQLSGVISTQGAAGSIYATLELTNVGKTTCDVTLGNTISAIITGENIVMHYQQTGTEDRFSLAPSAKVYSQIHYPNGPQCQSGVVAQPITFVYKTAQFSVPFQPTPQSGKLFVQACKSVTEKTMIDIWPLSQTPITQ